MCTKKKTFQRHVCSVAIFVLSPRDIAVCSGIPHAAGEFSGVFYRCGNRNHKPTRFMFKSCCCPKNNEQTKQSLPLSIKSKRIETHQVKFLTPMFRINIHQKHGLVMDWFIFEAHMRL